MKEAKSNIREHLKAVRMALSPMERRVKSDAILDFLVPMLEHSQTVMVYASKEPEVDTFPLIRHLLGKEKRVVVPIIQREDRSLRLSYITTPDVLRPSTFNVPEPIGHEISADPGCIDVAIIPLIGFDRKGNRVGYGAGYYDRFLESNHQMIKIGVAFACQEIDAVPQETLDIRMDYIVTENGVYRC